MYQAEQAAAQATADTPGTTGQSSDTAEPQASADQEGAVEGEVVDGKTK